MEPSTPPEDQPSSAANRGRSFRWRDNAFLADRLHFWRPEHTVESLTAWVATLSYEKYWEISAATLKLNTTWNITHASLILAGEGWFLDMEVPPPVATRWAQPDGSDHEAVLEFPGIADYYQLRRTAIEAELVASFPDRERLYASDGMPP